MSREHNKMGWTEEQLKCLDEKRCMKCKQKKKIVDKIPMFGGYVNSWGCVNKECK